jgi:micrococcal nuclease
MYKYNAQVLKVIDGDTVDLFIDLGFKVGFNTRIRLIGIDTPEKNFPYGKVVKDYLINLLEGNKIYLDVTKKDKYGRYLGLVYLNESDNLSVNELLINENMAKAYHGASRADIWTEEELAQTSHPLLTKLQA